MRSQRRRRLDAVWAVLAAVIVAVVAGFGAGIGDQEHITRMYIAAALDPGTGHLDVREVIDYDFGLASRHGIYRDIPDVLGEVTVESPSAPDQTLITGYGSNLSVRVGDPSRTIMRLHRYQIDFTLDGAAVVEAAGRELSWNAVGAGWTVPIDEVEIVLALPFALTDLICGRTGTFTRTECAVDHLGPGVAHVAVDGLDAGTGLTIVAGLGTPRSDFDATAALNNPAVPNPDVDDPGTGLIPPAALAGLAALIAAIPAAVIVRRAGREQVWIGGPADAAHGPTDERSFRRITEAALGDLATTEFEAPRGMSAVEGGILVDERVDDRHQVAWLLESAIRGEVELNGAEDDDPMLRIGSAPAHPHSAQILGLMFNGRRMISLDSHDKRFQAGWSRLESELDGWRRDSDHWDPRHRKARGLAVGGGVVLVVFGLLLAFIGGWNANRWGSLLGLAVLGGAAAGFGVSLIVRSWELHVRTPRGSARWLQIESFRRFLHDSEAHHVEHAARRGLLRQYTAWAVALGETDAWTDAVEDAVAANPELRTSMSHHIAFATMAPTFTKATSVASTTPSSSGSGGGGGGGGFSGGGGGGGGSW